MTLSKYTLALINFFRVRVIWAALLMIFFSCIATKPIFATPTRTAGLGLTKHSWMIDNQLPYIFLNPAEMVGYRDSAWFEYADSGSQGGIFVGLGNVMVLGVLSGRPVNTSLLNSGSSPRGLFDTAGGDYLQFFDSNVGGNLDASATSNGLGTLASRVSELNDPASNPLNSRQISVLTAFDLGRARLGLSFGYGFAAKRNEFAAGVRENQEQFKSETEIGLGFSVEIGKTFRKTDLALTIISYGLRNSYSAININNEKVEAIIEDAGAFDLTLRHRLNFRFHRRNNSFLYWQASILDSSTVDRMISGVTNFNLNNKDSYSRTGGEAKLGLSNELTLGNKTRVIIGSELKWFTYKTVYDGEDIVNKSFVKQPYEAEYTLLRLPLILGVETAVSENWQMRFALTQYILNSPEAGYNIKTVTKTRNNPAFALVNDYVTNGREIFSNPATNLNLGLSYVIGRLRIDWLAQIALFRDGPFFLSGKSNNISSSVAVIYNFSKVFSNRIAKEEAP